MVETKWLKNYKDVDILIMNTLNLCTSNLPIKSLDKIDIIIFALLKRIVNNYNAAMLLLNNEMNLEFLIIIRTVIESVFVFNGLLEKPDETFDKLLMLSNSNKIKLHKMAKGNEYLKANALKHNFDNLITSEVRIKDFVNLSPINTDLYEIAYRIVSNSVHINLLSIENFLEFNNENSFSLKENLSNLEIERAYFTLKYCIYLILSGLNKKYNMGFDQNIEEIGTLIESLN